MGVQTSSTYANESRYTEVLGVTADNFAIGEVTWDSTNSRYFIPIVHRTSTGNTAQIRIRCLGGDANQTDFIENLVVGSVYTSDTTAYDKPQVSFPNDGLGIGTATPTNYHSNANNLVIYEAGNAGITIATGTGNEGSIYFADGTTGDEEYKGLIKYNHSSNKLTFGANSVDYMTIIPGGNIGIGTASPGAKLQINGNTDTWGGMAKVYLTDVNSHAGSRNWSIGNGGTAYGALSFIVSNAADGVPADSTGTAVMSMDGVNKRVGIGTTSAQRALHIHKTSGPTYLRISDESAANGLELGYENAGYTEASIYNRYSSNAASKITFGFGTPDGSNGAVTILQNGNVGIGSTSPSQKLDLNGNIIINAQILTPGGSNLALNPNTGLVTVANNLQASGTVTGTTAVGVGANFTWTPVSGTNYVQPSSWIRVNTVGLYSGTNGAHFYPNTASDYGAWRINGARNGWNGITFEVGNVYNTLMSNGTTMGMYNDTDNEWMLECTRNGAVSLYFNAIVRVQTTSVGAKVVGNLRVDGGGNASDPLITTNSDTNTGIYFPGSGKTGIGGTGGLEVENGGTFGGEVEINSTDGIDVNAGAATLNASHAAGTTALYSGYGFSTATSQTILSNATAVNIQIGGATKIAVTSAGASITGKITATSKSFLIDHPTKKGKKLQHGSLEGPENGVYVRGKCESNVIELPDYWTGLVDEDTITVQITPVGGWQKLYVKKIEDNKVYVGKFGFGSPKFFYNVYGERKDIEKMEVEY